MDGPQDELWIGFPSLTRASRLSLPEAVILDKWIRPSKAQPLSFEFMCFTVVAWSATWGSILLDFRGLTASCLRSLLAAAGNFPSLIALISLDRVHP